MTHIATRRQPCSSCGGHYPDRVYVDFDAAYDGGTIKLDDSTVPYSIDDNIMCEDCVREGAQMIGMVDGEESKARIAELEEQVETRDELLKDQDEAIKGLNSANTSLERAKAQRQSRKKIEA